MPGKVVVRKFKHAKDSTKIWIRELAHRYSFHNPVAASILRPNYFKPSRAEGYETTERVSPGRTISGTEDFFDRSLEDLGDSVEDFVGSDHRRGEAKDIASQSAD